MNTLQVYDLIIRFVTEANSLAAALRAGKIDKAEGMAKFKEIIERAGKENQ